MKITAGHLACAGLLAAAVAASEARSQAIIGGDWRADVDRFAERLLASGLTPGMGVAVTSGDWVVYSQGYGIADADSGRPVGRETAFYIASSTKALTATAVVLLAEEGALDLDAPLTRYMPELRFEPPLDADSVSSKSLLTMTHGIRGGGPVVLRTAFTGEHTDELLIELLAGYGPAEQGKAFRYGNLGYNILGLVLDRIAGGWKKAVREKVLQPLAMADTTAFRSRLAPDRMAMPHEATPDRSFVRIAESKGDSNLHAAGGHFATPSDLARFVAAHASGGKLDGRRVFPEAVIASTHRQHADQDRQFGPFHRFGWGYGWDLGTYEDQTLVHRFGSYAGYRSHMSFMPEHELGVVVLVNGDGPASPTADLMAAYIYDRLLGRADLEGEYAQRLERLEQRAARYLQGEAEHLAERRARLMELPHPLAAYAGIYESPQVGRMVWRVVAGGLEVKMGALHSRAEVYDATEDQLRVVIAGGQVVDFEFPDGREPAAALVYAGETLLRIDEQ